MSRMFGTDGVRGVANTELTNETAYRLGQAAVAFLGRNIVVGKDTRLSGDMLEAAVAAGIMSMGGTVLTAGIIPTPGVAFLVRELSCDGGIVISASHNPPQYNGIKLFDKQGFKLSLEDEDKIESFMSESQAETMLPDGQGVGVIIPIENACDQYIEHALSSLDDQKVSFSGMKIALDVGHGAASLTTAAAFRQLGAEVHEINEDFDGTDINVLCGSTHLEPLKELVQNVGAAIGIAHDGDADRVMFVDGCGNEIDGDVVEVVCAIDLSRRGKLSGNTAVSTVMCNLGLVQALRKEGIEVIKTQVGDRFVLEAMRKGGFTLGGEQSGHMIFLEHNTTGDGLITALQFLAAIQRSEKTVEEAVQVMKRFPQILVNIEVSNKQALEGNDAIASAVKAAENELGEQGRVLVRASGTEPLVRVMVEAAEEQVAERFVSEIEAVVRKELSAR